MQDAALESEAPGGGNGSSSSSGSSSPDGRRNGGTDEPQPLATKTVDDGADEDGERDVYEDAEDGDSGTAHVDAAVASGGVASGTTASASKGGASTPGHAAPLRLKASIFQAGPSPVLQAFFHLVQELEQELRMPVWMVMQGLETNRYEDIDEPLSLAVRADAELYTPDQIAVLVNSPGGDARCAYHLGTAFARRKDGFVALVPYVAKSAATLMSLGASKIVFGSLGELGPLDAQLVDFDEEHAGSALNEVQSLERLHKFALDAFEQTLMLLKLKTRKKFATLLPVATEFVNGLVRPLFESIDVVHYTSVSRTLKVAEEYAIRLLEPRVGRQQATKIANTLISDYPEHGFVIDVKEAEKIGLKVEAAKGNLAGFLDAIGNAASHITAIGRVVPDTPSGSTP